MRTVISRAAKAAEDSAVYAGKQDSADTGFIGAVSLWLFGQIDFFGVAAGAGVAAIVAGFRIVRPCAPIGRLVARNPGAVADLLTFVAGERDLLGLAVVEIIDLIVPRPDMVAVLAVKLELDSIRMAVAHLESDIGGKNSRNIAEQEYGRKRAQLRASKNGHGWFPLLRRRPADAFSLSRKPKWGNGDLRAFDAIFGNYFAIMPPKAICSKRSSRNSFRPASGRIQE